MTGSTPQLDEFTIRVVDSEKSILSHSMTLNDSVLGAENHAVTAGPHADAFQARIGKTHILGRPVKTGDVWQASRKSSFLSSSFVELNQLDDILCRSHHEVDHGACTSSRSFV